MILSDIIELNVWMDTFLGQTLVYRRSRSAAATASITLSMMPLLTDAAAACSLT